jgi:DNA ligase-1
MTVFKPMLAASFDTLEELVERCECLYKKQGYINYTLQPKYDGIRAITSGGKLYSRTGKLIPNQYLRNNFRHLEDGLDGELYIHGVDFNTIQSQVMSEDGEPTEIEYVVFDSINRPFPLYYKYLTPWLNSPNNIIPTVEYLQQILHIALDEGYEGMMFRNLDAPYKHGRSSKTKLELVKIKAFKDKEGICLGVNQEVDKDGNLKESMGSLQMNDFRIGTGFDADFRKAVWDNPDSVIGKKITYKYQELSSYGIPRFPVFMRIREEE